MLTDRALTELRDGRMGAAVSQRAIGEALGWSQSRYWRFESGRTIPTVEEIAAVASLLGLELSLGLHPVGDPLRDKGQQALADRFERILSGAWARQREVPVNGTDWRSWDMVLWLQRESVGVEFESRFGDAQALVRRTRLRERDGNVDHLLIVGADTRANRIAVDQLRDALGLRFRTSPRLLLQALRLGRPLPGSGLILL
jgi:transcriptional regulator with XRE-family HTH domain